eukprot:scaffold78873_cov19-Tisochrysis_lutea.AAC.1
MRANLAGFGDGVVLVADRQTAGKAMPLACSYHNWLMSAGLRQLAALGWALSCDRLCLPHSSLFMLHCSPFPFPPRDPAQGPVQASSHHPSPIVGVAISCPCHEACFLPSCASEWCAHYVGMLHRLRWRYADLSLLHALCLLVTWMCASHCIWLEGSILWRSSLCKFAALHELFLRVHPLSTFCMPIWQWRYVHILQAEAAKAVSCAHFAGRGRGGNVWTSPAGCLMFSCSRQLGVLPNQAPFINYVVCLGVVKGIQDAVRDCCGP